MTRPSPQTIKLLPQALFAASIVSLIAMFVAIFIAIPLLVQPAHSSPKAARALERLNGMKEGTRRANRLMGVNTRRTPWCGIAVAYAVRKANKRPPRGYASAGSWRKYGRRVNRRSLRRGDVVLRRSKHARSGFHVGIVTSNKRGRIIACSGNTRNSVRCSVWRNIHSGRRK